MSQQSKALAAALSDLTPDQQRQSDFIISLCDSVRDELLKRVPMMPPEWDGHEIRELLYDYMLRCRTSSMRDRRGKRYRNYEAHCLTNNLY